MKNVDTELFKVTSPVKLSETPSSFDLQASKEEIKAALKKTREEVGEWQDKLYAHGKYAVLICLQGMDTSGKDSLIREVFKGFNSRGVVVHSFKVPSSFELKQNYLWRHYIALPPRGKFGVFNRTHYENVLITRVHPEYILNENIPKINSIEDVNEEFWDNRFEEIRNFEEQIAANGTIILKFFLNISNEEQRQRLLRRLNKPTKNWKFSPGDLKERKLWDSYREVYEDAINRTSAKNAPWYVIPANDKPTARYLVSRIMKEELFKYKDVQEPKLPPEIHEKIEEFKAELKSEKQAQK